VSEQSLRQASDGDRPDADQNGHQLEGLELHNVASSIPPDGTGGTLPPGPGKRTLKGRSFVPGNGSDKIKSATAGLMPAVAELKRCQGRPGRTFTVYPAGGAGAVGEVGTGGTNGKSVRVGDGIDGG
jgi:hypothetical protein